MTQFDLFGAPLPAATTRSVPLPRHATPAPPAAPAAPRVTPPAPPAAAPIDPFTVPDAWQHLLSRARYPEPVIVVSGLYTEMVLEALCTPGAQHVLWRDGRITQSPPADWPPRRRFLTPDEARALHRTHPLVLIEWPLPQTVHLRIARPGDVPLAELPLPPFHEH